MQSVCSVYISVIYSIYTGYFTVLIKNNGSTNFLILTLFQVYIYNGTGFS